LPVEVECSGDGKERASAEAVHARRFTGRAAPSQPAGLLPELRARLVDPLAIHDGRGTTDLGVEIIGRQAKVQRPHSLDGFAAQDLRPKNRAHSDGEPVQIR